MHGVTGIIFVLVILKRLYLTSCLVELSPFGDNVIVTNEVIIRETFNKLLKILNTAPEKFPKLERHFSIHKYLINITLQDTQNMKDIVQETRLSRIKDNEVNYADLINDVLNEDSENATDALQDEQTLQVIQNFITELQYLKSHFIPEQDIDKKVLESLKPINKSSEILFEDNSLEDSFENHTSPYWIPDSNVEIGSIRRIFHGKGTKIKNFPFVAAILLFQMFYCAGSIIASDLVITAASCLQLAWNNRFFRENPAFIAVRVGSSFHAGGGETILVQEVYFHPSYNPKTLYNNLCLLRLTKHLKFRGKKKNRIKKIMYDTYEHTLPSNTPGITIIGWGAKQRSNVIKFNDPIHFAVLDVYSLRDCQDVYSKVYVKKQNFCAGFITKGDGACNHDVGDPGIVGGKLVGVVSFGSPVCGTPDSPTVFTKVGFYSDWIEEIMDMVVPIGHKRTTTRRPWAMPTQTTVKTTIYISPLWQMLRTYLNHDGNSYSSLLKMMPEKDTKEFIKALRDIDKTDGHKNAPVSTIKQRAVTRTTSDTEKLITPIQLVSDEEIGHTQAEAFIDSFETFNEKKYTTKKKRHYKLNHLKQKKKPLTTTTSYEEIPVPKANDKNEYIDDSSDGEVVSTTIIPYHKPLLDKVTTNSINYLTSPSDLENLMVNQHEKIENKDATTEIVLNSLKNEVTPFYIPSTIFHITAILKAHSDRKPNIANSLYLDVLKKPLIEEIKDYDEQTKKPKYDTNRDQVQVAEESFTHSILEYVTHKQVNPLELLKSDDHIQSQESYSSRLERDESSDSDSCSDVTDESQDVSIKKKSKTAAIKDKEYIAYIKSLPPAQFYTLLSTAVGAIEKV